MTTTLSDFVKAYDVRGVVPDQLNIDVAHALGAAFAEVVALAEGATAVVIGHDMRPSSPELVDALARGITARRVLTDNGGCYRSRAWAAACAELGIAPKRTRAYRPQTNGKAERFNRTMTAEWAFAQLFASEADRRAAFPAWLHHYNYHRPHTGIGGKPPVSRLTNLPGQYT